MLFSLSVLFSVLFYTRAETIGDDICLKPPKTGACSAMFLAWYYDASTEECKEFIYGGCGGNENRFPTEDLCYKHCKEKLIQLHPPQNVTLGFSESNRLYIFWYPPLNYKLHEPDNTSNEDSYAVNVDKNSTSADTEVAHVLLTTTPKVTVKSDTNITSNVSLTNTNVTENNHQNSTASPVVSSTNKTNSDSSTAKPQEKYVTAQPEDAVKEVSGSANMSISDYIGKDMVPFHFAVLTHYVVTVQFTSGNFFKNITVGKNETDKAIDGLQPNTDYKITVSAVYQTNTSMSAKPLIATTRQSSDCYCDPFGTKDGYKTCNHSQTEVPWCSCKNGHAGLFCEICANGFYRLAPSLPCHACPCPKSFSTGTCRFIEGYLHCTTCLEEYTGNLCHRCANGYYRDHASAPSRCIKCEGCHNSDPGLICDPFTGKCGGCHYNTSGDKCDRCLEGFQGDPLQNIPCTPIAAPDAGGFKPPAAGVIAAVVVGIIVLLSGVVGFIVYKRMYNFPKNRPFWTIEFKEDHDKVNFSAVPDDDLDRQHEDINFYETQSKSKSKLPPYAQLKEDI